MAKRWVEHFADEYPSQLNDRINRWLDNRPFLTIVGISVYPYGSHYGAEIIVEDRSDGK